MNFDVKRAVFWIRDRLKQDKWVYKCRAKDNEQKGLLLIRIGIYEKVLSKIDKTYKRRKK